MKTFLVRSLIGIFFGAFIAVLATNSLVYFADEKVLDGGLFLRNSLGSIFCGWLFSVTPLYFEIRSLSLFQQTGLHFVTAMAAYFILAYQIGWIPAGTASILLFLIITLAIYAVIWICFYLYFKNQSRKLNEELLHIE
ncbi:DUF3021 domain-containing protein [Sediminibacillus halophilus]|uniref:DUF3021 domain-containing protein n=1 Tax=Sediminibacillus halophilus TaxID=482461 RepID=A0A1G9PDH8_9BACI|nr:DUF3021 domain-containing protein [Sediminibacillus halophilus]SDL96603.1 Protein of unknown function [Sediminibacillus halophilus]